MLVIWTVAALVAIVCGFVGRYVATQKRRSAGEGFWLGLLLGPLGVIVVAMLPTIAPKKRRKLVNRRTSVWCEEPAEVKAKEVDPMEDQVFDFLTERDRLPRVG